MNTTVAYRRGGGGGLSKQKAQQVVLWPWWQQLNTAYFLVRNIFQTDFSVQCTYIRKIKSNWDSYLDSETELNLLLTETTGSRITDFMTFLLTFSASQQHYSVGVYRSQWLLPQSTQAAGWRVKEHVKNDSTVEINSKSSWTIPHRAIHTKPELQTFKEPSDGILEQSMGARNPGGIGFTGWRNRFLGSLKV